MKTTLLFSLTMLAAGTLLADPKDDITSAANALKDAPNYSWRTIVDAGSNARFRPGPTDGKTEKEGFTTVSMTFGDNTSDMVIRGTNAAIRTADNGWQSTSEAMQDNGGGGPNPAMMMARMAQNFKTPAEDAIRLVGLTQNLKVSPDGITGDLTDDGAKTLLTMFRRGGNAGNITTSNAKGTATFWITDGKLTKFQTHVTGTVSFNGNDRDVDRTTTTEIKDIGTTKIDVADDAKKKLQ
jgi:hypothetical protein